MGKFLDKHCFEITMIVMAYMVSVAMVRKALSFSEIYISGNQSLTFLKRDSMILAGIYIVYVALYQTRILVRRWRDSKNALG